MIFQNCHIGHGTWPLAKFQKLHIHILFYHKGSKLTLFTLLVALSAAVYEIRPSFKIPIFGHETCSLTKDPEVAHIRPFYPYGVVIELIFAPRQRFPRYGPIFKIATFGYETWPLAKISEVAHTVFLTLWVVIKLIFALQVAVSEIRNDFQNCHIWAWNLGHWEVPEVVHIGPNSLSTSRGRHWAPAVFEIRTDFQNCHIWAVLEVAHIVSFCGTPGSRNWAYFRSKGSGFRDTGRFKISIHIFGHET